MSNLDREIYHCKHGHTGYEHPQCYKEANVEEETMFETGQTTLNFKCQSSEDRIRVVPWGDVHVGAPEGQCDWAKAVEELKYILETPNTYLVGMGDYMDCAQKMIQRGPNIYQASMKPMQQYQRIFNALKPLAEAHKIIGLHGGNHEEWIYTTSGMNVISMLSSALNVPFLGAGCDIHIIVNSQQYWIYSQHGSSNAKLKHTKLGSSITAGKDIWADIFLYGHTHQIAVSKGGKRYKNTQIKTYYVLTGNFLNWEGSYAQMFGLEVCPSGCPKLSLFTGKHDVHVSV